MQNVEAVRFFALTGDHFPAQDLGVGHPSGDLAERSGA